MIDEVLMLVPLDRDDMRPRHDFRHARAASADDLVAWLAARPDVAVEAADRLKVVRPWTSWGKDHWVRPHLLFGRDPVASVMKCAGRWTFLGVGYGPRDTLEQAQADADGELVRLGWALAGPAREPPVREQSRNAVGDLLAVLLGDGGHRQADVGTERAAREALERVHALRQRLGEARAALASVSAENGCGSCGEVGGHHPECRIIRAFGDAGAT